MNIIENDKGQDKEAANARWKAALRPSLLWLVLVIAFLLRIYHNGFGLPAIRLSGYEEDHIVERGMGILLGYTPAMQWPGATYFMLFAIVGGACFFFTHLHALLASAGDLFGIINIIDQFYISFFRDPTSYYVLGRCMQALISVGEVYSIYRLGRELDDEAAGLIGATFWAVSPMSVSLGHIVNVDDLMVLFLLGSVIMSMRYQGSGRGRDICIAALLGGLSTASKLNGLFVIVPIFTALASRQAGGVKMSASGLSRVVMSAAGWFILGFVIGCPYILTNPPVMLKFFIFDAAVRSMLGETANGWALIVADYLPHGIGWAPMIAGAAGLAAMTREKRTGKYLPVVVLLTYFMATGRVRTSHPAHALPIATMLCLGVGALFSIAARRASSLNRKWISAVLIMALAAILVEPVLNMIQVEKKFTMDDTRLAAKRYIEKNLRPGSRILLTGYGDPPLRCSRQSLEKQLRSTDEGALAQQRYQAVKEYLELKGGASWNKALMSGDKYPFIALSEALAAESRFSRAKLLFLLADPHPPEPSYDIEGAQPAQIKVGNIIERTRNGEFDAALIHPGESQTGPYADLRAVAAQVADKVVTIYPERDKRGGAPLELYLFYHKDRMQLSPTPPGALQVPLP